MSRPVPVFPPTPPAGVACDLRLPVRPVVPPGVGYAPLRSPQPPSIPVTSLCPGLTWSSLWSGWAAPPGSGQLEPQPVPRVACVDELCCLRPIPRAALTGSLPSGAELTQSVSQRGLSVLQFILVRQQSVQKEHVIINKQTDKTHTHKPMLKEQSA